MSKLSLWKTISLVCVLVAVDVIASPAQTLTTLYSFCSQSGCTDGEDPLASLVQGGDGDFYGTTEQGGANNDFPLCLSGCGTVFKITPTGTLTTLQSFCAQSSCTDGVSPLAGLAPGPNGDLYSTTSGGGASLEAAGTVFTIARSGMLTTLYSFCSESGCADGAAPAAGLVLGTDGNFYGTTMCDGANRSNCSSAAGTVFKMTPGGVLTTLYSFCSESGCADGAGPAAGLVQGTDGSFYGTTAGGGANNGGTAFKITTIGVLTTLYSFCSQSGCTDGQDPVAGLVQGGDGDFYGTTERGGANLYYGTVFRITPNGALTTLYSFCPEAGDCSDGEMPVAGLVRGSDGNFYGTTEEGGAGGWGTIFKMTPAGILTTLYSFCTSSCADGQIPGAALAQGTDGNFYGTTAGGGANYSGTVFRLSVGLRPFVETQPTSGKVGKPVEILGNNLKGATSITFNGTAATFTVVSSSAIKTSVPSGATTGYVKVTTPSGTLTSNVKFRVL